MGPVYVISLIVDMKKTRKVIWRRVHRVSARNVWYGPIWCQKRSPRYFSPEIVCLFGVSFVLFEDSLSFWGIVCLFGAPRRILPIIDWIFPLPGMCSKAQKSLWGSTVSNVWWMVHTTMGRLWVEDLGHLGYQSKKIGSRTHFLQTWTPDPIPGSFLNIHQQPCDFAKVM